MIGREGKCTHQRKKDAWISSSLFLFPSNRHPLFSQYTLPPLPPLPFPLTHLDNAGRITFFQHTLLLNQRRKRLAGFTPFVSSLENAFHVI